MRVRVSYVDSHFDDGLTSVVWHEMNLDAAISRWYALHKSCQCVYVNAHRT